ncbi:hypothetical protein PoB_000763900 [Plakobranchus ocellatus]|uniref:Uncharacterized protein n=1 Tax=Plakobranchus ocellatus TaxID=259542 RepID=A0AAV3YDM2_9GAST|nr:hypothetical protein PoB_000763900 [Plakobranchus ocellatus]
MRRDDRNCGNKDLSPYLKTFILNKSKNTASIPLYGALSHLEILLTFLSGTNLSISALAWIDKIVSSVLSWLWLVLACRQYCLAPAVSTD